MNDNAATMLDSHALTPNEAGALARLQQVKTAYQSFIKINYEHRAEDCHVCPTKGACCTDVHFVNVHITRLEAVALRGTLERTPRLTEAMRRRVYERAKQTIARYDLRMTGDTFRQTFACPLFEPQLGCLVHRRAKPAPCIQHACYENWEDLPPHNLQTRAEHRIEQLNTAVYGAAWAWLPVPVWLALVNPYEDGAALRRMAREWSCRQNVAGTGGNVAHHAKRPVTRLERRRLPVIR